MSLTYMLLRMKLPELKFESMVTLPTPLIGEIPEHYIAHIFKMYPQASIVEFFDGENVRKYEKKKKPKPADEKKKGSPIITPDAATKH